jgi:hypothetical protein
MVIFNLIWPCHPATFGKQFSEENSRNQLNNRKESSLIISRLYMDSDYPFGIFKLFLQWSNYWLQYKKYTW